MRHIVIVTSDVRLPVVAVVPVSAIRRIKDFASSLFVFHSVPIAVSPER